MTSTRDHTVYSNLAYALVGFCAAVTIEYGVWLLAATGVLTAGSMWIHSAEGTGADTWLPGTMDRVGMYTLLSLLAIIPLGPDPIFIEVVWIAAVVTAVLRPGIKWVTAILAATVFAGLIWTGNWLGIGLGLPPFLLALYFLQTDLFPYQTLSHGWWHILSAASVLGIVISYM